MLLQMALSQSFMTNIPLYICITFFLIHSSVSGDLFCLQLLAVINGAAVNIGVHVLFQTMVFIGYIPSKIIVSCLFFFLTLTLEALLMSIMSLGYYGRYCYSSSQKQRNGISGQSV